MDHVCLLLFYRFLLPINLYIFGLSLSISPPLFFELFVFSFFINFSLVKLIFKLSAPFVLIYCHYFMSCRLLFFSFCNHHAASCAGLLFLF